MKNVFTSLLIATFFLVISCNSEPLEHEFAEIVLPDSGIEITNAWARPGRINGVSAIYMNVLNGSAETDTLISLYSSIAGLVELHETFELEDNMMGMREVEEPLFPGGSAVTMKPGGLHVMLMQLNDALNEGDEVNLILNFALAGEISLVVPVQSQNDRN